MEKDDEPEMEKIKKHLKAEARIREVLGIVDDELVVDDKTLVESNSRFNLNIIIAIALLLVLGGVYLWLNPFEKKAEVFPSKTDTINHEVPPSKPEAVPQKEETIKPPEENNIKDKSNETIEPNPSLKKSPPIASQPSETGIPTAPLKSSDSELNVASSPLFASTFIPLTWEENSLRSSSNSTNSDQKKEAKEKYNQGKFEAALKVLTLLSTDKPGDWEVQLFKGICLLKIDAPNVEGAMLAFNKVIENDDNIFIEDAEWHLVETLLLQGNKDAAKKVIHQKIIAYNTHKYSEKAIVLLEALK